MVVKTFFLQQQTSMNSKIEVPYTPDLISYFHMYHTLSIEVTVKKATILFRQK